MLESKSRRNARASSYIGVPARHRAAPKWPSLLTIGTSQLDTSKVNRALADRLLRAVMGWEGEEVDPEKLELVGMMNDLALYKYNQYQQYRPGLQFIESLALWLDQFTTAKEREVAFDYIRH